jgi:lipid-A-disaccharide synthase
MGAAGRAWEVATGVAGALLSSVPFGANVVRSAFTAGSERRRVEEALSRWDPPPGPAPPPLGPRGGSLFVVAGEPSGDRIAAGAVAALLHRHPGVRVRAYGGPRLAAAGAHLEFDLSADPVMGIAAVVRRAPRFVGLFRDYLRILDRSRPSAVLLVDYPGFNLRAAEAARDRGIPVVWYVVPQIWAWAPWRAKRIGRAATDLCVVLPFERAFYRDRGIPATFVGYPLFEDREREPVDADLLARLRAGGEPLVALLPGSRSQEVKRNLPAMLAAMRRVRERMPGVRAALACATPSLRPLVDAAVAAGGVPVEVLDGRSRTLLEAARAALCVSGTVTMDCVHAEVPSVIVYQVSAAGRLAMPWFLTVPRFGLANLLAGRDLFPEHADAGGDAVAIAEEVVERLRDGPARSAALGAVRELKARLATTGCHDRVAAVLEGCLPAVPTSGSDPGRPGRGASPPGGGAGR